ncbi:MAG: CvpA family protein [Saprospiraceae bacterium]
MPIDLICLAVFAYGFWQGFNRGIIGTVFNIFAYIFGVILAFKMAPTTVAILERMFNTDNPGMTPAAFVVNLVFVMLIMRMAARSVESAFQALYIGLLNQVAGGLLMGGLGVMMFSILLWFSVKATIVNSETLDESRLYEPYLKDLPSKAYDIAIRLRPLAEDVWDDSLNWMDRLENYGESETEAKQKIYELPDPGDTGIEDDPSFGSDDGIEE